MIVNLPTPTALETSALKLYFRAWEEVKHVVVDFDSTNGGEVSDWRQNPDDDQYVSERADYIEESQDDLHAALSIIQQSNELALKARIAAVSPYLLLLNNDIPSKGAAQEIEFSGLRTLDAVDLPRAVNNLTASPVSDAYIRHYSYLRQKRNSYAHLGHTGAPLHPIDLCKLMVEQYIFLWPKRAWLQDRVDCLTQSRLGFFDDKNWSPKHYIMSSLDYDLALIPTDNFKKLLGVKRSNVKFGCFKCQDDWAVSRHGPSIVEAPTSYYKNAESVIYCLICDEAFPAIRKDCDFCAGPFRVPDLASLGAGHCYSCGELAEQEA